MLAKANAFVLTRDIGRRSGLLNATKVSGTTPESKEAECKVCHGPLTPPNGATNSNSTNNTSKGYVSCNQNTDKGYVPCTNTLTEKVGSCQQTAEGCIPRVAEPKTAKGSVPCETEPSASTGRIIYVNNGDVKTFPSLQEALEAMFLKEKGSLADAKIVRVIHDPDSSSSSDSDDPEFNILKKEGVMLSRDPVKAYERKEDPLMIQTRYVPRPIPGTRKVDYELELEIRHRKLGTTGFIFANAIEHSKKLEEILKASDRTIEELKKEIKAVDKLLKPDPYYPYPFGGRIIIHSTLMCDDDIVQKTKVLDLSIHEADAMRDHLSPSNLPVLAAHLLALFVSAEIANPDVIFLDGLKLKHKAFEVLTEGTRQYPRPNMYTRYDITVSPLKSTDRPKKWIP